jgi:hypothetical protein
VRQAFDVSLFGSIEIDSLVAIGLGLLFLALSSRLKVSKVAFSLLFAAALGSYFFSQSQVVLGALAIMPAISALLIAGAIADRKKPMQSGAKRLPFDGKRVAAMFLGIVIIIEVGALARWIAYPFYPSELYSDLSWKFAELESALFHSLGMLSPVFVVLLAFSFLYRWWILDGLRKVARAMGLVSKDAVKSENVAPKRPETPPKKVIETPVHGKGSSLIVTQTAATTLTSKHLHRGLLALAMVVAPLLMVYPHLPGINPGGEGVSTDEKYYTNWMIELRTRLNDTNGTWIDIFSEAFTIANGTRPLALLAILTIATITGITDLLVIRFMPVVLAPALVAVNYFLLRNTLNINQFGINRVRVFAAIGAVLAIFSPQIVVGEYAGLLANWMAIIIAYLAFYLIIRIWEARSFNRSAMLFAILFMALVLTMTVHVYTWTHVLVVIVLFAGLSYVLSRSSVYHPKMKLMLLMAAVLGTFALDYVKSSYFSTPFAAESDSPLASNIQAHDTSGKWDRLQHTMSAYVGGFLSNPALFLLGLVWVIRARSSGLSILMLSMLFIFAVPAAIGSVEFQTRVIYNTPIHIAATLALMWTGGTLPRNAHDKNLQKLLIVGTILISATFALRAMASLALQLPPGYELETDFLLT